MFNQFSQFSPAYCERLTWTNYSSLLCWSVLICADLYCLALHWSLHIFALRAHISTLQDSSRGLLIYTFYTSRADSSVSWQWLVLRLSHLLKVTQESCSVRWCSNQNPFLNNLHSDCASFLHLYSSSACTSDYSRPVAGALKSILCMYNYIFIYICFQVLFLGQASYSLSAFVFTLTGLSLLSLGQEQVLVILFMFSYMFIHVHTCSYMFIHVHTCSYIFMSVHALCMSVLWHANRIEHWCQFVSVQETIVVFVCLPA